MARLVIAGVVGFLLLGFCGYCIVTTWVYPRNAPLKAQCDEWLNKLEPRWLVLKGCVLDVDLVIVESDAGDYEKLANRQKGLSTKPYPDPPNWIAAWIPVRTEWTGKGLVRAVYRLDSADLMKWINTLERADEREKERMWADPLVLRRLSRPGLLPGRAERPSSEALQKAFGSAASGGMLAVIAGPAPEPSMPPLGILAGLAGFVLLAVVGRSATKTTSGHLFEASAEQAMTKVNTSDVKLEIGALEELRREERKRKPRNRKID